VVRREEFAQLAGEYHDLPALCSALINLANERGGPDNITAVAAHFEGEGLAVSDGTEGVGHRAYEATQSTTVPTLEPVRIAEPPEAAVPPPGRWLSPIRGLSLILILVGVLLLLLSVWR
jgi:hypothetical protein